MRATTLHILMMATMAMLTLSCGKSRTEETVVPRDPASLYDGLDVSSYQQNIDWKKVSHDRSIKFVYIKATEGATYSSPHYAYNLKMARRYGIKVGSYHYLRSSSTLHDQFVNFIRTAPRISQDLVPMVDVEKRGDWTRQQLIDSLSLFIDMLKAHYGVQPMIYSTMTFYNHNLSPYFNGYHLYIGRYSNLEPDIKWNGRYTIWQFTETGMVDGIPAPVDLCKFSGRYWINDIRIPHSI